MAQNDLIELPALRYMGFGVQPNGQSSQSVLKKMTRTAMRISTKAIKESLRAAPQEGKRRVTKKATAPSANWTTDVAIGTAVASPLSAA